MPNSFLILNRFIYINLLHFDLIHSIIIGIVGMVGIKQLQILIE